MTAQRRDAIRAAFERVWIGTGATDDDGLDALLDLNRAGVESGLSWGRLLAAHGRQRLEAADLGYRVVRDVYRSLGLNPAETIVDLGCGYGRLGLFGAVLWEQRYEGIEIVAERVTEAGRVQRELGLHSLRFSAGNILTCAWPPATYYLMLNSVLPCYLPQIMERFREIAAAREITIASLSTSNQAFRSQPWLREAIPASPSAALPVNLRLFTSRVG